MNFSRALLRFHSSLACVVVLLSRGCHGAVVLPAVAGGGKSLAAFAAEKIIERIQSRMRYGFPLLKIEPLSPLKLNNRSCAVNLSFLQLNSSFDNLLLDGLDRFTINRVKFNWRNKSMDFSLTFRDLRLKGTFDGAGSFVRFIPIVGSGNFTYTVFNMTNDVYTSIDIVNARLEVTNFTMVSNVEKIKSNVRGLTSDNLLSTRVINRMMNRLIELTSYNVFRVNQRLINEALDIFVLPPLNRILSKFVILAPSTKYSQQNDPTVYLYELSDKSAAEYLAHRFPPPLPKGADDAGIFRSANDDHYSRRILCA